VYLYVVYEDELKKNDMYYVDENQLVKQYKFKYRNGFRVPLIEHSQDAAEKEDNERIDVNQE
jgi:hypothetical protein